MSEDELRKNNYGFKPVPSSLLTCACCSLFMLSCTDNTFTKLFHSCKTSHWASGMPDSTKYKLYGTNHDSAHNTPFHLSLVVYNNMPYHKTSFLSGLVLRTPTGTPVNWHSSLVPAIISSSISSKSRTKLFQIFNT